MLTLDNLIALAAIFIVAGFALVAHLAVTKIVTAIRQLETTAEYLAAKKKL